MKSHQLKVGEYLTYQGSVYTITEHQVDDTFELKRITDSFHIYLSKNDLLDGLIDGNVKFVDKESISNKKLDVKSRITADFLTFPDEEKSAARRRLAYVKGIIEANLDKVKAQTYSEVINEVATAINDERKPHWNTVYRWHREYLSSNGDVRQLTSNTKKKGNRTPRLRIEVQNIINERINNFYLTTERPSIQNTHTQICEKIQEENEFREAGDELIPPSYNTVRDKILKLPPELVTEKHFGKHRAKVDFRAYQSGPCVSRILERIEADHTPLPCFVVDDIDRLPLGRPTLTSIIDYFSRAVTGFYISFNDPSTRSFLQALRYSIFPKNNLKKTYPDIENDWECFGLPELLIVDNGKEFHSEAFFDTCNGLGIPYQHAPPNHPWYKGVVERHFGTVNRKLLDKVPGKTFHNVVAKDNYDPSKNAVISFSALIQIVHEWIIDIYNQTYQKSLGGSPAQKWRESAKVFPPRIPPDLERLTIELGIFEERKIRKDGIQYVGLMFNSNELGGLRRKLPKGTKVKIKINPDDISRINVLDPITDTYFSVPASDQRITRNKTLHQYKTIRKFCLDNEQSINRDSLLRAERRINAIILKETKITKNITSRKRQAKYKNISQDIDILLGLKKPTFNDFELPNELPYEHYSDKPNQKTLPHQDKPLEDFYADDIDWEIGENINKHEDND